jgi:hypothetical protein
MAIGDGPLLQSVRLKPDLRVAVRRVCGRVIGPVLTVAQMVPDFWSEKLVAFSAENEKSAHIV